MAKAQLRDDGDFPVDRSVPSETAAALVAEIQRLYRLLDALPWRDHPGIHRARAAGTYTGGSLAYTAIEQQIRRHAARHWLLTSGVQISATPPPSQDQARDPPTLRQPWLVP